MVWERTWSLEISVSFDSMLAQSTPAALSAAMEIGIAGECEVADATASQATLS